MEGGKLTAIDDLVLHHIIPGLRGTGLVDPGGLKPVIMGDKSEFDFGVGELGD